MSSPTATTPTRSKTPARQNAQRTQSTPEKSRAASSPGSNSIPVAEPAPAPAERLDLQVVSRQKETVFRFHAPTAARVALAADFTNWEKSPVKMSKGQDGFWQVKVLLSQGRHHYKFLVDGEWRDDPRCPLHVPNQFGTNNAVVEVA